MIMMGISCRCILAYAYLGCRTVAMAIFTSGPARCEAALHGCGTIQVCLFYAIATVFHGGDMMYEMRKPAPIPLLTQGTI